MLWHLYTYSSRSEYSERSLKTWTVIMRMNAAAGHQLGRKMSCKIIQFSVHQLFNTLVRHFCSLLMFQYRGKEHLIVWFIYFTASSDVKDLDSTKTCLKDSELSPTEELSGKKNLCLISPLSKSKPLAFGKYPSRYHSFLHEHPNNFIIFFT